MYGKKRIVERFRSQSYYCLRGFLMKPFQSGFVDNVQYVNSVSGHYTGNVMGVYCAYLFVCQDVF